MSHIEIITLPGDRWDLIAYRAYGDPNRTAELIAANRGLWPDGRVPMILPAGLTLKAPVLQPLAVAADSLPPWKR